MASLSCSLPKLCFNSNCNQLLHHHSRRGWRRRTGDFADLCDRCATAFEEGNFCESFHLNASGWRACESCGKKMHCGCIVSSHTFILLDAGGIECITCTKKTHLLAPNPAWPPPSLISPVLPERVKDHSGTNWSSIAASGPIPWHQAPMLFNQDLHPKMPLEVDISTGIDRHIGSKKLTNSLQEKRNNLDSSGRLINGSLKDGASHILEKGTSGSKCEEQPSAYGNDKPLSAVSKDESSNSHLHLAHNHASKSEIGDHSKVSVCFAQGSTRPTAAAKNFGSPSGVDSSGESRICNERPQGRNQLLPRYWPKITDKELKQISGDTNCVITPLFEKVLTASDAGKMGRLVLPKKCAEVYLPPISNPEGIPLLVQDLKGQEWVFQFRFWPNNNSRMYVLEGIIPYIQSMQLRAGDTVTFSRLEPHGKLVMGCRKNTSTPSVQGKESVNTGDKLYAHRDAIAKSTKPGEVVDQHYSNSNPVSSSLFPMKKANIADPARNCIEGDEISNNSKVMPEAKLDFCSKRKNTTLDSKSKRLRIETEELIELKLTWEQAQGLFRCPSNDVPKVVVIEGYEIEEYEEPPIIGRPTIIATDDMGEIIQWVQCENCFKWRKVPGNAIVPSSWTCSENLWDPKRSLCSVDQELTSDELQHLLPAAGAKKLTTDEDDPGSLDALEGLDALANLAIQEDRDVHALSSQSTTKHPRHRPGCSCIVCIQPGKGQKHKPACTCNVCSTVKRRFKTLLSRREMKQSEKEAETAHQKLQQSEQSGDEEIQMLCETSNGSPSHNLVISKSSNHDQSKEKLFNSPSKGQIDLNIHPEREGDLSSFLNSVGITRTLQDATQQKISSLGGNSTISQPHLSGVVGNYSSGILHDGSRHQC